MYPYFVYLFCFCVMQHALGDKNLCGDSSFIKTNSCSTQILGEEPSDAEPCKVEYYPANSAECSDMSFGPITSNSQIGGVRLRPYIMTHSFDNGTVMYTTKHTVLNITFSNIKWKTMKFRFQRRKDDQSLSRRRYKDDPIVNHCRNIVISNNITINDQSVLYYDCYWSLADQDYSGQSHILDFEARDDSGVVNRGRYYFNIPSANMLDNNVSISNWKPFTYISVDTSTMKLHLLSPPGHLRIQQYRVKLMKSCEKGTRCEVIKSVLLKANSSSETVYTHSLILDPGSYYFTVSPLHWNCMEDQDCLVMESPKISISREIHYTLNICIASLVALVVASLFAYYIVLLMIRKYWCRDDKYNLAFGREITLPAPPKIMIIYSPVNKLHAECVSSFVQYLRTEYGFDVKYDVDIASTSHGDPYIWAEETFRQSTHIVYISNPPEESNTYNNIYDQPIVSPYRDVDKIQLTLLKSARVLKNQKHVINVVFEHSIRELPLETKYDKVFYLIKDWQKLIAFLSKNLLPKQQMMRSEKGKRLLEDLNRAKKMLDVKQENVIIRCDKSNLDTSEKKVLL